jgi:uncharacterized protein (TIGR03066 family)
LFALVSTVADRVTEFVMKAKARASRDNQQGRVSSPKQAAGQQAPRGGPRLSRWLLIGLCVALVAGVSFAVFEFVLPGKIPPELVGEWRVVGGPLDGMTLEFKRNGTMTGRAVVNGKHNEMEGEAEVSGTTLRTTTTNPMTGRSETGTQTIVTLTRTELVTEDQKGTRITMSRVR